MNSRSGNRAAEIIWQMTEVVILVLFISAAAALMGEAVFADSMEPGVETGPEAETCQSAPGKLVTPDMIPDRNKNGLALNSGTTKAIPLLVIVVGFKNVGYDNFYDWSRPVFRDDESISAYYRDMSYNKMTFEPVKETCESSSAGCDNTKEAINDGIVHVKLDGNHECWDSESNIKGEYNTFTSALKKASEYVDFSQYDSNGDGTLSNEEFATLFIVAGYDNGVDESEKKHEEALYLRSHQWRFSYMINNLKLKNTSIPTFKQGNKTVTLDYFCCSPEKIENDGAVLMGRFGSMAHELGHHLGLPDLYDTSDGTGTRTWERYDVMHTSLMGSGSWSMDKDGKFCPSSLDPWSRIKLGWRTYETITKNGTYTVTAQDYTDREKQNKIYRVNIQNTNNKEYYLIENRNAVKWDSGLPDQYPNCNTKLWNGGLVFWHIDEAVLEECYKSKYDFYYDVNVPDHRPGVMPMYPESKNSGNQWSFIGDGPVFCKRPFLDKQLWDASYSKHLGSDLELPAYSDTTTTQSTPEERMFSGNHIQLMSDAGSSIDISYFTDAHVHDWERSFEVPANICTKGGSYTVYLKCKTCGATDQITETHPAGKHYRLKFCSREEPTCEDDGTEAHYSCYWCHRMYSDAGCTKEVDMNDLAIPATGHMWDDGEVWIPATYYYDGEVEYTCLLGGKTRTETIPQLDHSKKKGDDGTACGTGAAIEVADKAIRGSSTEKDMAGSGYSRLKLKSPKQGRKSIQLKWNNFDNEYAEQPDYFIVYGAKCGKSKYRKLKEVYGTSVTIKKIGTKALKPKTYYKFLVVAVQGSVEEVMSTSKTIHVATKGSKAKANYTGVSISKKIIARAGKMKTGASLSLKVKAKKKKGTTVAKHRGLRYEAGNKAVATVTSKGVIKAKSAGACTVYVYTQNGKCRRVNVEVS